ncbi:kinesin-like protein KIN-5B [Malania oleifera]|uniref:kinesin-like protein KIN-5B n=1 Tax=Malania oleifera TaxID=397392 RepID=UPI0025AE2EC4|nr:kinesin-like protein KIN-5B [Malania oleifera]XP_057970667.1 kinesin-like protein KIN-5B [Malania oleifera]
MMSLTPDQFRKVGLGVTASPSPFLTPRHERRRPDSRVLDWNSNRHDRDREVNVQVLLRCRPLSDEEQRLNVPKAISCNEHKKEVIVLQSLANKQIDRVFAFDKVFGPKAQQRSIYDQAVAPIVNEVLEGFNCTVFAYGQTGTGKTYTMEGGGMRGKSGELPAEAGVIPRAVRQIFDTLEAQNADYRMKVTFLELYNEEITDLLAPEDYSRPMEDRQRRPISLMEDGKGCVIVRGLEEEAVYSANEIYNVLERGAAKRHTADTLLNKRSSRSHSVFSITVYVKEATVGDEELIKCGKLNLVDLAGSENISRSGAREGRAREAGEINKSLLTLGRVITALVEHSNHIPYRDSRLTRLLRDSLGGKTKTCIIATISPSVHSLDETLSTLDYAHRAKNIKNKPEANQKMFKAALLKDLYLELEKMKQDVRAAREKNGVYIPLERFAQDEAEKKARNEKIEQLEIDLALSAKEVEKYCELYHTEQEEKRKTERELKDCKINLENCNKALQNLQENHRVIVSTLKEKKFIISKLLHSENSLVEHAKELCTNLKNASEDIDKLFTKIDQKNMMEAENHRLVLTFGSDLDQSLKHLHKIILGSVSQQQQHLRCMEEHVGSFLASKCDATQALESKIKKMTETYASGVLAIKELTDTLQRKTTSDLEQIKSTILAQTMGAENFLVTAVSEAKEVICNIQNSLDEEKQLLAISAQKLEEGLHRTLVSAQMISKATVGFFNDLHHRASKLMTTIEESKFEKFQQLAAFEKMFKEEAAREEKVAMEKIALILETLTSKKTAMVSEASRNIQNSTTRENKRLQQEMSNMQQVSANAKEELCKYAEKMKTHFLEDTFSSAETRATMEYCLQESTKMLNYSKQQWDDAQLSIRHLNKTYVAEIESTMRSNTSADNTLYEEFSCKSSYLDAELDARTCEMLAAVNDSLMLDHESKKKLDSMANLCFNQLKSVQEQHGESISNIRNQAEQCFTKDYLVEQHTNTTLKKQVIAVPSLASIEEMRAAVSEDLNDAESKIQQHQQQLSIAVSEDLNDSESKIQQHQQQLSIAASLSRTPFTDIN